MSLKTVFFKGHTWPAKKTVLFFKEILLFDGLLFFKRPSLDPPGNLA